MKKIIIFISSSIIGILATIFLLSHFDLTKAFNLLKHITLFRIFGFIVASILVKAGLTLRWYIILKAQNIKIKFLKLFGYKIMSYTIGYLTPISRFGGEPLRAYLLKKEHKIPFKKGLSSTTIDLFLQIAGSAIFFFIGVFILVTLFLLNFSTKIILLIIAISFMIFLYVLYKHLINGNNILTPIIKLITLNKAKKLIKQSDSFEHLIRKFFCNKKKIFYESILINFITWGFMIIEFKFALLMIGINAGLLQTFMIIFFICMAYLLPVPAAFGGLEGGQLAVFSILKFKKIGGVSISIITRIRDILWCIVGISLLSLYGIKGLLFNKNNLMQNKKI